MCWCFSKNEDISLFIYFWILVFSENICILCWPHRKYFKFWLRSNSIDQTSHGFWLEALDAVRLFCNGFVDTNDLRCAAKIPRNRMGPGVGPNCIAAGWRYLGSRNYFLRSQSDPFPRKNAISIGSADFRHSTPDSTMCAPSVASEVSGTEPRRLNSCHLAHVSLYGGYCDRVFAG